MGKVCHGVSVLARLRGGLPGGLHGPSGGLGGEETVGGDLVDFRRGKKAVENQTIGRLVILVGKNYGKILGKSHET